MARYRIRIECLDSNEVIDEEYKAGMECEGFTLIARAEDGLNVSVYHMSIDNMSGAMQQCDLLMQSAILADARYRILEIENRGKTLKAIFGKPDD